jgi:hypothetical protein
MITEKNHKLLTSQIFVTDCTKKGWHLCISSYKSNYHMIMTTTASFKRLESQISFWKQENQMA